MLVTCLFMVLENKFELQTFKLISLVLWFNRLRLCFEFAICSIYFVLFFVTKLLQEFVRFLMFSYYVLKTLIVSSLVLGFWLSSKCCAFMKSKTS
jgi:hypothetical protein